MRPLKRLAALLSLALLAVIAGCSSLTLAYQQLPLAAGLWANSYFDLDGAQRQRLKDQLQIWQAWHRREELPQWLALLKQAHQALDGGVTRDELLALERGARASAERCLQQAAPLAAPLLASLRPEQWAHLQKKMDEKTTEWREKNAGPDGAEERGKRFSNNLERWVGDLDRSTRRQARAEAASWRFDLTTMAQGRATRQAHTLDALRAWSRQDLAGGTALLMRNLQPQPAEQAYREQVITGVLKVLNGLDAQQRQEVHQHWTKWENDLRTLQAGG
ncbi:hypothetical protein ABIC83_000294 [Roseateles asaccharophilus]|uniref:DUF6279 family lipoprotein n=1 Tax=Roseateles asaccharophilus TaxID=582607 RepID=UPI0038382ED6